MISWMVAGSSDTIVTLKLRSLSSKMKLRLERRLTNRIYSMKFTLLKLMRIDRHIFPSVERFAEVFKSIEMIPVPVPADCRDGFLGAYWKRPRAYLDPLVRESISTFSKIGNIDSQVARLERDIDSGAWDQRYSSLHDLSQMDLGYRLMIASGFPYK